VPRHLALSIVLFATAVSAGCATQDQTASPGVTQGAAIATVAAADTQFQPQDLDLEAGQTVMWRNDDDVAHTATHGTGGTPHGDLLFDFELAPGQEASHTFEEAGNFPVTCRIHPEMQMNVTVAPTP
jgi:cytochrome c peroxidase